MSTSHIEANNGNSREESHKSKGGKDNKELSTEESKNTNLSNKLDNQESRKLASLPTSNYVNNTVEEKKSQYRRIPARNWGCRSSSEYIMQKCIGKGTFGKVYKAKLRNPRNEEEANMTFALKMFKLENETEGFPITGLREIAYLKKLNHENIIKFKEIVTDRG